MKKALSYFFIFIGIGLLVISGSRSLMKVISDKRYNLHGSLGLRHPSDEGDLIFMAYLDDEKQYYEPYGYSFSKPRDTANKNIDLYIWGDSYVLHVPDSAFASVSHYHFGRRDFYDLNYTLDRHKKNILIIENGERFVRGYLRQLSIFDHVRQQQAAGAFYPPSQPGHTPAHVQNAFLFGLEIEDPFNPDINQNLEFNLFNYNFIDPVRLLKARSVYKLFGRASGDVALSEDRKYLFLKQTIAAHDLMSCYEPVGKRELSQIVDNMDSIYKQYKKEGFDEVYFSMIPNPASILQPGYYNGLIPDIQKQAALKGMAMIDVYSPFSRDPHPDRLYRAGDTHWNNNGLQIWIQVVNDELIKKSSLFCSPN